MLLDLSAAFDTVNHNIILKREETMGGIFQVLSWFRSYLGYDVSISKSEHVTMTCGVLQGSILGLLLFKLYMPPLGQIT